MPDDSIIIVGAGLAGLSAGCYLQMNGYRTRIFEHQTAPGGVVAAWKRKDYTIDGGVHFWMGRNPEQGTYALYEELGVNRSNRFIPMETYASFTEEATGRSLIVTGDLDRLAADMTSISPVDSRLVEDLAAGARALRGLDLTTAEFSKPHELKTLGDKIRLAWASRAFIKYFRGRFNRPVRDYAASAVDPWLRYIFNNLFLPEVPVWFLMMLLAMVADRDMALLDGESRGCAEAVERRYKELGGDVTYRATVEEILVADDRVVGVRLFNGAQHRSRVVISAADGFSTLFKMLGGGYVNRRIERRYRSWPVIDPLVMVSFGIAREFPNDPWLQVIRPADPFTVGKKSVDPLMVRIFNYSSAFAPKGKTVVQATFETDWDSWFRLKADPPLYREEKERVASEVLKRLELHYPGVSRQVEIVDVATPHTTWRYTRNHRGAYMGWLPTPEALRSRVEKTLPGLDNFYMAGQWVMPGGGVPACLYSGRHAAQLICRDDDKNFETTVPIPKSA